MNGWNKYHYYWCKDRSYQIKWRLINDFLEHPDKYTLEYRMSKDKEVGQIKLL